ncbi:hypothetical protein [Achromobacter xylosoxidans]|uniref:hypothetical protein n=1 Tax=Alcaligenes xylosoxydans xylosoxydans TaxID=85698 RepID=UPI000B493763|nr:hypothetical protein [Achromobacter xylosoxidans]
MLGNLKKSFAVYFVFCAVIAFVDIDFDSETEATALNSMRKQTLYMNAPQLQVYLGDLDVIQSAGRMGGSRARLLHGMESDDIHALANEIRQKSGRPTVDFPSKSIIESMTKFFVVPFAILFK